MCIALRSILHPESSERCSLPVFASALSSTVLIGVERIVPTSEPVVVSESATLPHVSEPTGARLGFPFTVALILVVEGANTTEAKTVLPFGVIATDRP
jgi:hypothetical protein